MTSAHAFDVSHKWDFLFEHNIMLGGRDCFTFDRRAADRRLSVRLLVVVVLATSPELNVALLQLARA